jgi:hypothetical protein
MIKSMPLHLPENMDALETGEHIVCYYCEETRTMIAVTDGETVVQTQEPPEHLLARYPKALVMTFAEASRRYLLARVRRAH